jgi:hypothetical protein
MAPFQGAAPAPATKTRPMPTKAEVHELMLFLAANADVARADGADRKVAVLNGFQETVRALRDHAEAAQLAEAG